MYILGIDEAGRGPLAGPVTVAGVIFDKNTIIKGLGDSKKISEKKRNLLFDEIISKAKAYKIITVSVEKIDELNILQATLFGMNEVAQSLQGNFDKVLVDGNQLPKWNFNSEAIVKGDSKILQISAASILAKVYRDRLMLEYDKKYPKYCFSKHKGYPTKLHIEKINEFGVLDIHRKSFKPIKYIIT